MLGRMLNNAGKKIFKKNIDFDAANLNLSIKHEYEKNETKFKGQCQKRQDLKKEMSLYL